MLAGALVWDRRRDSHAETREAQEEGAAEGFGDLEGYDQAPADAVAEAALEEHFAEELCVLDCAEEGCGAGVECGGGALVGGVARVWGGVRGRGEEGGVVCGEEVYCCVEGFGGEFGFGEAA